MNRTILTKILIIALKKYLNAELDKKTFFQLIDDIKNEEYDEAEYISYEVAFIETVFSKLPYYEIENKLAEFSSCIQKLSRYHDKYYGTVFLIKNGCLAEILPHIKRRIKTEIYYHILELAEYYYRFSTLTSEDVLKFIVVNACNIEIENYEAEVRSNTFKQYSFSPITQNECLREKISKSNYNKRKSISDSLVNYLTYNYDNDSLTNLFTIIIDSIDSSDIPSKDQLIELIKEASDNIKENVEKNWLKTSANPQQLTLFNYFNNQKN